MGREDKTHQSPDEEYMPEFTGEETGAGIGAEKGTGPQFRPEDLSDSQRGMHPTLRKIIGILGLILIIIVVGWFLRHQEKQKLAAQGAVTPVVDEKPATAMMPATPEASNKIVVAQPTPTPPVTMQAVPSNPAINAPNTQAMQAMDQESSSKLNELTQQVHTLADSMTRISQNVQTLETKVTGLSRAPVTVLRPATAKHKIIGVKQTAPVNAMAIENTPVTPYVVTGVIPRRAWISGPYGSTFTVTTGDTLPVVGKVISINVRSGEVITSGGTIEYGEEDH